MESKRVKNLYHANKCQRQSKKEGCKFGINANFFSSSQPGALDCKKFGEKKDQGIPNLINSYLT